MAKIANETFSLCFKANQLTKKLLFFIYIPIDILKRLKKQAIEFVLVFSIKTSTESMFCN